MYMGLMKRGLLILSSLFLSIWITAEMHFPFLGFLIAIICIAAFFDAHNIRKRIVTGEYVEDSVADITGLIKRFKLPIKLLIMYILLTSVFSYARFYTPFRNYYNHVNIGSFIPMVIFIVVIYTLFNGRKKRTPNEEPIDMRNEQEKI